MTYLEFESEFTKRATELGLTVQVDEHVGSGTVTISWKKEEKSLDG